MSASAVTAVVFMDDKGQLCAIKESCMSLEQARKLAKKKLYCDKVKQTHEYNHMYFGFGKSDGETENNWWLIDNSTKNSIPVYVFREVVED